MMRTLLLIADDEGVIRHIRLALRQTVGFRTVATLDGRASVRVALAKLAPDVVVIDEMCQRTNALARLKDVIDSAPEASVVLLTNARDSTSLADAFGAGADAVISRDLHPATLGTLLREVASGSVVHSPRRVVSGLAEPPRPLRAVVDQDARTIA